MATESPSQETAHEVARSVLRKNLSVKPGETVTIEAWPHTLPWAVALARETRRLKATPLLLYEDEASYWDSVEAGESKVVGAAAAHEFAALSKTDVYIHMWGPGDRVRLHTLPPKDQENLFGFNPKWYQVAQKAGVRGARLELGRPYASLARAYSFDADTWTNDLIAATLVDPSTLSKAAAPIAQALSRGKQLRITHSNGTDLTLGLAGRPPRVYAARPVVGDPKRRFDMLTSLPAGALRVALDERVADGTIAANRTCYYDNGIATGATFEFSRGRLTEAHFDSGEEFFEKPYEKGGAGRDRPGFFSIGLNPKLHNTPQVEDIEAGAVMTSVGGNGNLGGKNRSPFFGWSIVAGATVEIDGRELPLPG
jgi:leucyl aminopeptidase (aminopeptidase T)